MMKALSLALTVALHFLGNANIAAATGGLNGLPILNGPIPPVPYLPGMKQRIGDFIHPGLWHTHDDLERIKNGVANKAEPWHSAYANFTLSKYSQADVRCHPSHNPKVVLLTRCSTSCRGRIRFSAVDLAATTPLSLVMSELLTKMP